MAIVSDSIQMLMDYQREVLSNTSGNIDILDSAEREHLYLKFIQFLNTKIHALEEIVEMCHDGIIGLDKAGKVTLFNQSAEKITGLTKEHVIGKHADTLSISKVSQDLENVISLGQPQYGHKYCIGQRSFVTNRFPIKEHSEVVGAIGIAKETTSLEELTRTKEKAEKLTSIINATSDGIAIVDRENKFILYNMGFGKIAKAWSLQSETFANSQHKKTLISIAEKTRNNKNVNSEMYTAHEHEYIITAFPILNDDCGEVVINVRDLTELNRLKTRVEKHEKAIANVRESNIHQVDGIIARSKEMVNVVQKALKVASYNSTVLITGESGTGKEVIARLIRSRYRKNRPFITVNCASIPENLLESELFGYEPGAFTGANQKGKPGLFEIADGGMIFLDEVGDLPLQMQAKLLRVLQDKVICRVGGTQVKSLDIRIISATNHDLSQKVAKGEFREDLFFRLNVVPIHLPPLRERKEEILSLINHFLLKLEEKHGITKRFSPKAMRILTKYDYPGNVRELENLVERLLLTTDDEEVIDEDDVLSNIQNLRDNTSGAINVGSLIPIRVARDEVERQLILKALKQYRTSYGAAKVLGISQSSVIRKMQSLGISPIG